MTHKLFKWKFGIASCDFTLEKENSRQQVDKRGKMNCLLILQATEFSIVERLARDETSLNKPNKFQTEVSSLILLEISQFAGL